MSGNNSLERRYSFNMAQGIPIAESSSFSWGSASPKALSYSNCKNSTSSSYFNDEIISNSNIVHLSKIDARIAADVQSKGLTSRIVKYQESGTRLNRSMSAHNLFSKPGQFPTVTLKKSNLPYRAAKRELSMIRIPPPNKSSFYGNTVSSLLRSSSVIGLQCKLNEDVSTENRPIIHPHPTETDMAPTRSVLDVLKEISRKRINSDALESEETSKKYCSHTHNDFVDTVANKKSGVQEKYITLFSSPRRYKRQRDCITSQQSVKLLETKTSPEQAKKRICNYNNDITSSLSSSIKRKTIPSFEKLNQTLPKNFQINEIKNSIKQDKFHHPNSNSKTEDIRFENLEDNWKKTLNRSINTSEASFGYDQNNKTVATQVSASESVTNLDEKIAQTVQKPRLTLFNKKFDDSESKDDSKTYEQEEKYDNCTGIPFVKPKKIASNSVLRNPIIERTQKSKLALMLSGLKGELYQNSDLDELDSTCKIKNLKPSTVKNRNLFTPPPETTKSIPTLTTVTSTTTITSTSNVEPLTNVNINLSSTASPLVGLKLKPSNENVTNMLCTAKNTDLQSQSSANVLGGFSLCTTTSSSKPSVQSCSTPQIEPEAKPAQISAIPVTNIAETTKSSTALFTSKEKYNEISDKPQLPANKQFTTVCTEETLLTSNVNTDVTSSTLAVGKTFGGYVSNLDNSTTDSSTLTKNTFPVIATSGFSSTPIVFGTSTASTANRINAFNVSIPSTSSSISTASLPAPIMFGVSTNPDVLTKTISTNVSAVKSSVANPKILDSSFVPMGLLNFNTTQKSSSSEIEKHTGSEIAPLSFNIDKKNAESSINFEIEPKNQNCVNQSNLKAETKDFTCNRPAQFASNCLSTKTIGSSLSVFNNVTRSDNNIYNPSGISSIFGSKLVKGGTEINESNLNNKSEVLVTPPSYGNNKSNEIKSIPFSFNSSATTFATTSSSDVNTYGGGFSFNTALLNSKESGHSDQSNQTLNSASVAASPNNFTFGSSSNKLNSSNIFDASTKKPENLSQGGFSFGALPPLKTSTFTFGAEKSHKNDDNSSTGFSFGVSSNAKQNVLSPNKPFAFGSPQPIKQNQSESNSIGNSFNSFGSIGASTAAQSPTFNFAPGSLKTNTTTNLFAPTTSNVTTGHGDRIIRRATRRLQK